MLDPNAIAQGAVTGVAASKLGDQIEAALNPFPNAFGSAPSEHVWLAILDKLTAMMPLVELYLRDAEDKSRSLLMLPIDLGPAPYRINRLGRAHCAILSAVNVTATLEVAGGGFSFSKTLTGGQWADLDVPDSSSLKLPEGTQIVPALLWLGPNSPAGLPS